MTTATFLGRGHGRRRITMARTAVLAGALLSLLANAGCRRPHVEGTVSVDAILKTWTEGGFDTQSVANIEPDNWNAGACSRGPVAGLDVLICEYASDDGAATGEKKMTTDFQEESVPTGAVLRTARTVLSIADRGTADPSGRTIARLGKLFREQR